METVSYHTGCCKAFILQIESFSESDLAHAVRLQLLQAATFSSFFRQQAICSLFLREGYVTALAGAVAYRVHSALISVSVCVCVCVSVCVCLCIANPQNW